MSDSRFEDLMGRLLDDELTEEESSELFGLIRDDPARQEELRAQLWTAELLALSEDDLRQGPLFVAATRSRMSDDEFVGRLRAVIAAKTNGRLSSAVRSTSSRVRPAQWLWPWAIAAAVVVALIATFVSLRPRTEPQIARITELNGSLCWIGDGGRLMRNLEVGTALGGGTLDAPTSDAWVTLEFRDGSVVTVSGPAMLTISEHGQKELHLREGEMFARVTRQARGRPLLIHTTTAELEVLGTQLNVEAVASETRLNVNEGRVRVTRLVDGSVAEVSAHHQVVATADRTEVLRPTRRADPVNRWESNLMASMGKWLPPEGALAARLRALPIVFNRPKEGPFAVYVAGFGVSQCGAPPVLLEGGSRFRIRGRIGSSQEMHFGITTKKPEGGFGGKFEVGIPAPMFKVAGGNFDVVVNLGDMKPQKPFHSGSPIGSELEDCHLFTVDVDANLEVMHVELLPLAHPGS